MMLLFNVLNSTAPRLEAELLGPQISVYLSMFRSID